MDRESFELCKEVWEKTKWVCNTYDYYGDGTPRYTSDYLLEKLPKEIDEYTVGVVWSNIEDLWRGEYGNNEHHIVHADTPLKSLLKLTIALHKSGELK